MTKEETTLDENVENEETTTQVENAESEESETLDDLFNDDTEESQEESDADKVKRLEEKLARIEKGVKKLATDKGIEKKAEPKREEKPKQESSINDEVVEELLLTKHPEAEHILDDLKETAKLKGVSVLKLYRESKYFQGEAKAIADTKKSEEEAKSKIKAPSNGTVSSSKKNISEVKPEDVVNLTPEQKKEWVRLQAEKERMNDE